MIDILKKIIKTARWVILSILVIAIALFSLFTTFASVFDILIKIIKIAGFGSIGWGVVISPFFIFGAIQIFRGFCSIFNSDLKKIGEKSESILGYFYIPATVLGCILVFAIVYYCGSVI